MSEHRQPNLPAADHPAGKQDDNTEARNAAGASLGDPSATREQTIAKLKAEFPSFQPADLPRDVEDNDAEWQRTGGAPVK